MKKHQIMIPNYEHSIINVSATIIKHYGAKSDYKSIPILEDALNMSKKHVVLMLLDGMGTNILTKHLKPHHFLRKYQKDTITSVFPPTTVAATNSVLAVKSPYETGYLGWVQYFREEDTQCVIFLNHDFYHPNKTFDYSLRDKYLRYETIDEKIKKASSNVMTYELYPSFRENGFQTFHDQLEALKRIICKDESNFTYLYWTNPDMTEHDYGTDSDETNQCLSSLNQELEAFSKVMNSDSLLIIIADHGLIDVTGIDLFLDSEIENLLLRKPSIEPRATNFFIKAGKKRVFKQLFNERYGHAFKLYTKKELMNAKLLGQGDMHIMTDQCLGDYIAIATTHYMFNMKEKSPFKAHHAGLTQGEMEVPLIIYHT